jgi:nicotinamidase-related amidase
MERAFGLTIPCALEDVCHPAEMALLVYDMQVGIVGQLAGGAALVARVRSVLEGARACGMRVCYTRHMSLPREFMGSFQYRMAMNWQHVERAADVRPWFLRDSPSFPIVPDLAPRVSEPLFDKITMSAFEGTPLAIALRDCGLRALAIVGAAMEVGIEPTIRHAADLGFIPVVIIDACGAGNEEASRRCVATLEFAGDTLFTTTEAFLELAAPLTAEVEARGAGAA